MFHVKQIKKRERFHPQFFVLSFSFLVLRSKDANSRTQKLRTAVGKGFR